MNNRRIERFVGAARFAADHMQEDYDLRARIANANLGAAEMRNSELARKIFEAESGRNALMDVDRVQAQASSSYAAVDAGISAALKNNDFGAYAALLERRNAMSQADEKTRAEALKMQNGRRIPKYEELEKSYDFYTRKIEAALANGRQDEAAFYERAREALVAQRGNAGAPKSDMPAADKMKNQLGGNNPKPRTAAPTSTAAGGKKASAAQQKAYGEVKEVF